MPIDNALEHGCTSLEVDIAFDGLEIRVTHEVEDLINKPFFESNYLKPYFDAPKSSEHTYILLVDLKNFSNEMLDHLHNLLVKYDQHLVKRGEVAGPGKTRVLLSGAYHRINVINENRYIYFFIDGRLEYLSQGISPDVMPWISTNFTHHSSYKGYFWIGRKNKKALQALVDKVHGQGYRLRFWKTPDRRKIWNLLRDLGVDVIATDDVVELSEHVGR